VSSATVRHQLIETGRKAKNATKKQLLNQKLMKKRLAYAKQHKSSSVQDKKKVLFSDECHFLLRENRVDMSRSVMVKILTLAISIR